MRLIDADELKKSLNFVYDCAYIGSKSKEGVASDIIDEIDNAPTVDVNKWLNPDIDPELALENIRRIVYERGKEE